MKIKIERVAGFAISVDVDYAFIEDNEYGDDYDNCSFEAIFDKNGKLDWVDPSHTPPVKVQKYASRVIKAMMKAAKAVPLT